MQTPSTCTEHPRGRREKAHIVIAAGNKCLCGQFCLYYTCSCIALWCSAKKEVKQVIFLFFMSGKWRVCHVYASSPLSPDLRWKDEEGDWQPMNRNRPMHESLVSGQHIPEEFGQLFPSSLAIRVSFKAREKEEEEEEGNLGKLLTKLYLSPLLSCPAAKLLLLLQ